MKLKLTLLISLFLTCYCTPEAKSQKKKAESKQEGSIETSKPKKKDKLHTYYSETSDNTDILTVQLSEKSNFQGSKEKDFISIEQKNIQKTRSAKLTSSCTKKIEKIELYNCCNRPYQGAKLIRLDDKTFVFDEIKGFNKNYTFRLYFSNGSSAIFKKNKKQKKTTKIS